MGFGSRHCKGSFGQASQHCGRRADLEKLEGLLWMEAKQVGKGVFLLSSLSSSGRVDIMIRNYFKKNKTKPFTFGGAGGPGPGRARGGAGARAGRAAARAAGGGRE